MPKITPHLWFDDRLEEAMELYVSVFPNSKVIEVSRFENAGPDGKQQVMTARFILDGQEFMGLNGGPEFRFNEAVSFYVHCKDQAEVDYYWGRLGEGGEEQPCGWLKDRFGLSWQIIPEALGEALGDPDPERAQRAMQAMLQMRRIDIAALEKARAGS